MIGPDLRWTAGSIGNFSDLRSSFGNIIQLPAKIKGYGVPFDVDQYEQLATAMRECKGKVMVSINDHPDIRVAFVGFRMEGLDIKYSPRSSQGAPQISWEQM